MLLNNREIACVVWIAIFFGWCLLKKDVRRSIAEVVKAAIHRKLIACFLAVALYATIMSWSLAGWRLWNFGDLKTVILWTCTAGTGMVIGIATGEPTRHHFRKVALGGIKLGLVLEFVVNLYVFRLAIEIVFVPIAVIFTILSVYTDIKDGHRAVNRLVNGAMTLLGGIMALYAGFRMRSDWAGFARAETLIEFLLPLIMTVLFIPLLYALLIITTYESFFVLLKVYMHDRSLRRYTRWEVIRTCGLDYERVNRWRKHYAYTRPKTRVRVRRSLRDLPERNPIATKAEPGVP